MSHTLCKGAASFLSYWAYRWQKLWCRDHKICCFCIFLPRGSCCRFLIVAHFACNAGFVAYVTLVALGAVWLVFYASRRWGNTNPLVYVTITGTIGSLSVMGCKGLGVGIKQSVAGTSQLMNPAMWMILVTVAICITVQVLMHTHIQCHFMAIIYVKLNNIDYCIRGSYSWLWVVSCYQR